MGEEEGRAGREHSQSQRSQSDCRGGWGEREAVASWAVLAGGEGIRDKGAGSDGTGRRRLLLCRPSAACPHPRATPAHYPHPDPFSSQASRQALGLGLPRRPQNGLSLHTALECELTWSWGRVTATGFCLHSLLPGTPGFLPSEGQSLLPGAQCSFLASP